MISEYEEYLGEREREVLLAIIEGYLETASPIGSKYVCENYRLDLSPASIRKIMASLEEEGLIYQPHSSAGRIPTAGGYKFYIKSLIRLEKISRKQKEMIKSGLNTGNRNIENIMSQVSRSLSNLSHYTGVVLAPDSLGGNLLRVEFIRIKPKNILVIFIFENGLAENRLVVFDKDISEGEINVLSGRINETIGNYVCGIDELKIILRGQIERHMESFSRILEDTFRDMAAENEIGSDERLFVGPETFIFNEMEFSRSERIKHLIRAMDDKKTIIRLLGLARESRTKRIFIGSDSEWSEINGLSLVTAPYHSKNGLINGSIGIIGPSRMNYSQVIPIIDFMAGFLCEII